MPQPKPGLMPSPRTIEEAGKNFFQRIQQVKEQLAANIKAVGERYRRLNQIVDKSVRGGELSSDEKKELYDSMMAFAPLVGGGTAFHGSRHLFEKFDISKVGTGQGAQSYGHGLYFAENQAVAKTYQAEMGGVRSIERTGNEWRIYEMGAQGKDVISPAYKSKEAAQVALDKMPGGGQMYQVNIPDEHIGKMLDWDKPLSEQTKTIRDAVKAEFPNGWSGPQDPTGGQIIEMLGHGPTASNRLKEYGIPGIKYLDQGSRQAGEGTRNFVVFDPEIIDKVTKMMK